MRCTIALRKKAFSRSLTSGLPPLSPSWLSDLLWRLKEWELRGMRPEIRPKLRKMSKMVDANWLELLAGREGFLAARAEQRGLDKHRVAWGDQDAMGHMNNVVYNKYAESARVNWLISLGERVQPTNPWKELMSPQGTGLILKSIKTDYKFPVTYPDHLTVLHKVAARPDEKTSNISLDAIIISHRHRRIAARCFEDIVVYDYEASKKTMLAREMARKLREVWEDQEQARVKCENRTRQLLDSFERLGAFIGTVPGQAVQESEQGESEEGEAE